MCWGAPEERVMRMMVVQVLTSHVETYAIVASHCQKGVQAVVGCYQGVAAESCESPQWRGWMRGCAVLDCCRLHERELQMRCGKQ